MTTFRSLVVLTVLAAAGCDKTNDVPRMQDEALDVTATYQRRFDELARRAADLGRRGNALSRNLPSPPEAQKTFLQAMSRIEDSRRALQAVPSELKKIKPEDLRKAIDGLRERADRAATEATADLWAVENSIWIAEQQPAGAAPPAPEPPTEGSGEGSAAPPPIR